MICAVPGCPADAVPDQGVCISCLEEERRAMGLHEQVRELEIAELDPPEPEPEYVPAPIPPPAFTGDGSPYGVASLGGIIADLSATPEGNRNNALNRGAYVAASIVAAGHLDPWVAVSALKEAAARMRLPRSEAFSTIRSGWESGLRAPRDLRAA